MLRWDIDIVYQWAAGDGTFYTDIEQLRYNIRKSGLATADVRYEILLRTSPVGRR